MTDIAKPRLAATLLLLRNDPFEVLMVRRNSGQTFASALVFPGGVVSPSDYDPRWRDFADGADTLDVNEAAVRIAAFRETFEETGILPLNGGKITPDAPRDDFFETVRSSGGQLPLDQLVHYAHWVTPETAPKRVDTQFFLIEAPDQHARCDGVETVALEWLAPADILERDASLPFATRLNLMRLAESADLDAAMIRAAARSPYVVRPRLEQRTDGAFLVIPAEAGYPITEARKS